MKKQKLVNSFTKTILPLGLIVSSLGTASFADESNKGFYVTAGIGAGNIGDSTATPQGGAAATATFGSGTTGEFGFGYDFGNDIRTELTYGTLSGDLQTFGAATTFPTGTASVTLKGINLNIFKDFSNDSRFTPYLGAGLSSTTLDATQIDQVAAGSGTAMGYNLKAGSSYEISNNTDFYGEFAYSTVNDITASTISYTKLSTSSFNAGIRFRF